MEGIHRLCYELFSVVFTLAVALTCSYLVFHLQRAYQQKHILFRKGRDNLLRVEVDIWVLTFRSYQ